MTVSLETESRPQSKRRPFKQARRKHPPRFPPSSQSQQLPAAVARPGSAREEQHPQQQRRQGRHSEAPWWQAARRTQPQQAQGHPSPAALGSPAPQGSWQRVSASGNPPTPSAHQPAQQQQHPAQQQQQAVEAPKAMKFGKRLASEAARRWSDSYFDYKAIKKAIKDDIDNKDALGANFHLALLSELSKVSQFYSAKASQLEATLHRLQLCAPQPGSSGSPSASASAASGISQELTQLRGEVQELIKFVALNYLAVVKAIKKRNRHLKEQFGPEHSTSLRALDMLGHEVFFTSPRLAALSTQAEILAVQLQATQAALPKAVQQTQQAAQQQQQQQGGSCGAGCGCAQGSGGSGMGAGLAASAACRQRMLEEYQCPICLETLHNPVVLTCAHRFCWGCLVAHCTAARHERLPIFSASSKQPSGCSSPEALSRCSSLNPSEDMTALVSGGPGIGAGSVAGSVTQYYSCPASLRLLEEIALREETEPGTAFYNCPVCRKPQVLEVESLQIDQHLASFIDGLRASLSSADTSRAASMDTTGSGSYHSVSSLALAAPVKQPAAASPWGILPPQAPQYKGRLTVLLDVDGTLISSFTPRRAPRLPASVRTHVVGVGSKLNPQGVFVVERPGLRAFLEQLALFAEVVIFTAGLEDYARPIIDALDPDNKLFAHRIYREGCVKTEYYQCVKDMARANRPLGRTVLVDDTPLAFLHQPDNGIPVLGFRGDPDDRLLMEAVLPLLQSLDQQEDVRETLQRRFDMAAWFKRHGFPVDRVAAASLQAAEQERQVAEALGLPWGQAPTPQQLEQAALFAAKVVGKVEAAAVGAAGVLAPTTPALHETPRKLAADGDQPIAAAAGGASGAVAAGAAATAAPVAPFSEWLLLASFDRTLVDFSPIERVVEALAPELLPSLVGQGAEAGSDVLQLTNSLLEEMQRRGVSRDQLLATLQELGSDFASSPSLEALRIAKQQAGARVALLSDSNSVFMSHLLAGAKAGPLVDEVLTNPASFERAAAGPAPMAGLGLGLGMGASPAGGTAGTAGAPASPGGVGQKLVVKPRGMNTAAAAGAAGQASSQGQGQAQGQGHRCCGGCPAGLCRGGEVAALRQRGAARRIAYCGDGAADVCAALALGPEDVMLARRGGALARLAEERAGAAAGVAGGLRAKVVLWSGAEDLAEAVRQSMVRC